MLGQRIKIIREENQLSQIDFAKLFNVSNTTVSQWESGKRQPDYTALIKIADYFNVSVDYLLGRTNQRAEKTEQKQNINVDENIDVEKIFIAAHDESGKPVPATEGLKKLIKEVILEVRNEK